MYVYEVSLAKVLVAWQLNRPLRGEAGAVLCWAQPVVAGSNAPSHKH